MPGIVTADFIGEQLYKIFPDGKTVSFPDALVEAEKLGFRKAVESMAFGQPDSITRKGNNFTAVGKVPATKTEQGITIISDARVTFKVDRQTEKLIVDKITGVQVSPWGLKSFQLRKVTITDDGAGNIFLFTWAYGIVPTKVKVDQSGVLERQQRLRE